MSSLLDSFAVCLGAVSALRAAICAEHLPTLVPITSPVRVETWQQHALTITSGIATAVYALAGGSREVLITNALILTSGAVISLLRDLEFEGVAQ